MWTWETSGFSVGHCKGNMCSFVVFNGYKILKFNNMPGMRQLNVFETAESRCLSSSERAVLLSLVGEQLLPTQWYPALSTRPLFKSLKKRENGNVSDSVRRFLMLLNWFTSNLCPVAIILGDGKASTKFVSNGLEVFVYLCAISKTSSGNI